MKMPFRSKPKKLRAHSLSLLLRVCVVYMYTARYNQRVTNIVKTDSLGIGNNETCSFSHRVN
jgi:hypothetical protein